MCYIFYRKYPSTHCLTNKGMGALLKFQNKRQNTKNGEPPLVVQYVKNPPFGAGDVSSIPGQGTKLSCAEAQLSLPCAAKTRHIQRQTKSRKVEKCLHA